MTYRSVLDAKNAATPLSALFAFSGFQVGETISSASVVATVYSGTDPTPNAIISGPATLAGVEVTQLIVGGLVGVTYLLTCNVLTNLGNDFSQPGYLVIAPTTV
jgi:hypothetical protein